MVLPIIIGGTLLSFITYGKEFFGIKLYNQILIGLILLSIGIVSYFIYKLYKSKEKIKDTVFEKYQWITEGAKSETETVIEPDREQYETLPKVLQDLIYIGEYSTQILGKSAITTGQETAQNTYDSLTKRYGPETAERYEELNPIGRTLVSIGDYFGAIDAGAKTQEKINSIKDKLTFWK